MSGKTYVSGLDLGQLADHTAFVTAEQTRIPDPDKPKAFAWRFDVCHIQRWPLGTPYTRIVDDLRAVYEQAPLCNSTLVVDKTGVGVAVVDMVKAAGLNAHVQPYMITAGFRPGDGTVPKVDLVAAVQALLGTERLRFARGLDFVSLLTAELKGFHMKVTADRNETFAAGRDKEHDDLVLALALLCWYGSRYGSPPNGWKPKVTDPLLPASYGGFRGPGRK